MIKPLLFPLRTSALLLAAALAAHGHEMLVSDFTGNAFPLEAAFGQPFSLRTWKKDEGSLARETRNGKETGVARLEKEGVAADLGAEHALTGEWEELTIHLALRQEEVANTPVFVKRIRSTSGQRGYFSFHAQCNGGNEAERRGTLRFTVTTGQEVKTIASTKPWEFNAGEWTSVALVFTRGEASFYVDGTKLGESVPLGIDKIPALEEARSTLRIGSGFAGAISNLVVLPNRSLSEAQLRLLHEEGVESDAVRQFLQE